MVDSSSFVGNFQRRDCLTDSSSFERGLVGERVSAVEVVAVEAGAVDVFLFGALRACRRNPDRLEV